MAGRVFSKVAGRLSKQRYRARSWKAKDRRITRLSTFSRGSGWNSSGDALRFLRSGAELGEWSAELAVTAEGRFLVFSEVTARADIWRLRWTRRRRSRSR